MFSDHSRQSKQLTDHKKTTHAILEHNKYISYILYKYSTIIDIIRLIFVLYYNF